MPLSKQFHQFVRDPKTCDVTEFLGDCGGISDNTKPPSLDQNTDKTCANQPHLLCGSTAEPFIHQNDICFDLAGQHNGL